MQILKPTFNRIALVAAMLLLAIGPLAHVKGLRYGMLAILAVWLCILFRQGKDILMPGWQPLLAFGSFAALSLVWSVAPELTFKHWWQDFLLPVIAAFACYRLALVPGNARWLLIATFVYTCILFLLSLLPAHLFLMEARRTGLAYFYPGVGEASTAAAYLLPVWLALFSRKVNAFKLIAAIALGMSLFIGFASFNRMFWIAALFCTACYFLLERPVSRKTLLILLLSGVSALSLFYLSFANKYGQRNAPSLVQVSTKLATDSRLQAWQFWLDEAGDHILTGKGYGRYTPAADIRPEEIPGFKATNMQEPGSLAHSHNTFLNIVLQLGLPGLLLVILILQQIISPMIRTLRLVPEARPYAAGGIALLVAVFMKNATDDFVNGPPGILLWAYIGIALALCQNALNNKDSGIEAESR